MELFAVFETWHLGDGNYPPLAKGQVVNLSFEIEPDELELVESAARPEFHHLGEARYRFTGSVLRIYGEKNSGARIVVVETERFRFYMHSSKAAAFSRGDVISGGGTLLFDHYLWVEFLSRYPDPPDLFYPLRVADIWRYTLPERFISRSEKGGVAWPTRVESEECGPNDVAEVDAVSNEDFVHYVLQFSDRDIPAEPVARTFLP
jgi:hypothetical protein